MKFSTNVQIVDPKSENKVISDVVLVYFAPILLCLLHPIRAHVKNCNIFGNDGTWKNIFIKLIMIAKQGII